MNTEKLLNYESIMQQLPLLAKLKILLAHTPENVVASLLDGLGEPELLCNPVYSYWFSKSEKLAEAGEKIIQYLKKNIPSDLSYDMKKDETIGKWNKIIPPTSEQ